MNWELIADWAGIGCLLVGSLFTLIAAIGAFRYEDLLSRQHVATKPQIFSLIMFSLGVTLLDDDDVMLHGIWIGGLTSGFRGHEHEGYFSQTFFGWRLGYGI